ncbi:MAG TPA: hypothetical protein VI259_17470 [Gemmatimonadaceae bacterium]
MRLTSALRRRITAGLLACAAIAVACVDMSAPKGAASISPLQLPSPFVVRGDTMRDSAGNVAPVTVTSYTAEGVPIADFPFETFVLDTMLRAHFTLAHLLIGDKLGTVTTVGQASGVQTLTVNVPVTVQPTKLLLGKTPDTLFAPLGSDSATSVGHSILTTIVKGVGDTAVQGVIVRYRITRTLASSSPTTPSVYLSDFGGKPMNADTTDASGNANKRQVTVFTRLLTDQALISGQKIDTVVVEATASYKGSPLSGSPLTILVPVKVSIAIR